MNTITLDKKKYVIIPEKEYKTILSKAKNTKFVTKWWHDKVIIEEFDQRYSELISGKDEGVNLKDFKAKYGVKKRANPKK